MKQPVLAIIGMGNMGKCLLNGLIKNGYPPDHIWASDHSLDKLTPLETESGIHITQDNHLAMTKADVIILAVKPQHIESALMPIKESSFAQKPLIISIAAGIRTTQITQWLGTPWPIVRAMPNTPALLCMSATGLYANPLVSAEQHQQSESILRSVGIAEWLSSESQLDIVTALSGSGPAYFFFVMEALESAATEMGLPRETAHLLTLQTGLGASRMAMETAMPLETLRQQVTSPGGTTEAGINALESLHLRNHFKHALNEAFKRAQDLADRSSKPD